VQDSVAFKIGADALLALYDHDLEQFTLLQMNLGREVSRRLRFTDEQLFRCRMAWSRPDPDGLADFRDRQR
jgi:CRP/FNR family cyclic AMP-dependent transcriptional regulator